MYQSITIPMKTRKVLIRRGRFMDFRPGNVQRVVEILRKEYGLWFQEVLGSQIHEGSDILIIS